MVTRILVPLLAVLSLACSTKGGAEAPLFGGGASTEPTASGPSYDTGSGTGGVATQVANNLETQNKYTFKRRYVLTFDGDTLSGEYHYAETLNRKTELCSGVLRVTGSNDKEGCNLGDCDWGYSMTVREGEMTGSCDYPTYRSAYNLAEPDAFGYLAYYTDFRLPDGEHFDALLLLGHQHERSNTGSVVFTSPDDPTISADPDFDPVTGTFSMEENGTGATVDLLVTGDCDDLVEESGEPVWEGETYRGYLLREGNRPADLWQVSVAAGQTLHAVLTPDSAQDTLRMDLLREDQCLQSDGSNNVELEDGSLVYGGYLNFTAPADGVWTIAIFGDICQSAARGPYSLTVSVD